MLTNRIYLDYAATTPVDQRVLKEMTPYFSSQFGNAASHEHGFGWEAEDAVKKARKQIAHIINGFQDEIIFTSGATESNNLAIKGIAHQYQHEGNHIITCMTEHKSVLDTVAFLRENGLEITLLEVDSDGMINLQDLEDAITSKTILITLMMVNNETGVVHPVAEIGAIARKHDIIFHTDATQALGKTPIDVHGMNIDLLSISAHKIYGPKGIGALYVGKKTLKKEPQPIIHGGGHEKGMRSGTLNVPGIVGFGAACQYCMEEMEEETKRLQMLNEKLVSGLRKNLDGFKVNGHAENRIPGILSISFPGIDNINLIRDLHPIAVSSGSACTSESVGPSHVIEAMGAEYEHARSVVRFSLGRFTTEDEIETVAARTAAMVQDLRLME